MASVNKVIIVGNLGADPDVKTFDNGGRIANVSIATSEKWTDRQTGEQRENTEWHRVVFNDRLADVVAQYLRKGSQVYVEGSLRTRKWQDQQTGQDRYTTEIRATSMQMLGNRNSGGDGQNPAPMGGTVYNQPPYNNTYNNQTYNRQATQPPYGGNADVPFGNDGYGGQAPYQGQNYHQGQGQQDNHFGAPGQRQSTHTPARSTPQPTKKPIGASEPSELQVSKNMGDDDMPF